MRKKPDPDPTLEKKLGSDPTLEGKKNPGPDPKNASVSNFLKKVNLF